MINEKTVLLVDESKAFREVLALYFRFFMDRHYQILQANSDQEAIIILDSKKVDLVISDLRVQSGFGLELKQYMEYNQRKTPIYFLSGNISLSDDDLKKLNLSNSYSKLLLQNFFTTLKEEFDC